MTSFKYNSIVLIIISNLLFSCTVTTTPSETKNLGAPDAVETSQNSAPSVADKTVKTEEAADQALNDKVKWEKDESLTHLRLTGVSKPMLYKDHEGELYLVYIQKPERKVNVLKRNAASWKVLSSAGLPTEKVYAVGLSFDNMNTPHLFYDNEKGNLIKFSLGKWEKVGTPFSKGEALSIQLSFDAENTPWVAYGDSENDIKSTVKKYSGGKWLTVGTGLPETAEPFYLTHQLGHPLLMTKKANLGNDPIQTYQLLGNKWVVQSKGENVIPASYKDVLVFDNNEIYLAYCDKQADYKLTVKKFSKDRKSVV